jgi:uncharacterized protein YqjF (DUF2071 family)
MVPSNSTAKNQARWDAERRLGSGLGMAVGTQSSRKRQLRITRNFAYYEKEESSTTPVGGRSFIAHKWKFYAETKISYKSLLGTPPGGILLRDASAAEQDNVTITFYQLQINKNGLRP